MEIRIPYRKVGILSFELDSMGFQDGLQQPECRSHSKQRQMSLSKKIDLQRDFAAGVLSV
jgi:hypothetical protein